MDPHAVPAKHDVEEVKVYELLKLSVKELSSMTGLNRAQSQTVARVTNNLEQIEKVVYGSDSLSVGTSVGPSYVPGRPVNPPPGRTVHPPNTVHQ